jgi:CheY-like chemotaxis protein/HPt (histidine-containing phosphotransfer) domain-containing protein
VVDDDPVNRKVAMGILRDLGITATEAESGHAAIAELARASFDFVLLDCMMPGMDGYETARRIRDPGSGAGNAGLPIVAMTARASEEDRRRCADAGMNAYSTKPLAPDSFVAAIREALASAPGARPRESVIRDGASSPALAAQERPVFEEADFTRRYATAPELAAEILGLFLDQTGPLLATAWEAVSAGRLEEAADLVHRLKGSSGAIGARRLSDKAGEIESACRRAAAPREDILVLLDSALNEHGALVAVLAPLRGRYLSALSAPKAGGD